MRATRPLLLPTRMWSMERASLLSLVVPKPVPMGAATTAPDGATCRTVVDEEDSKVAAPEAMAAGAALEARTVAGVASPAVGVPLR